MLRAITVCQPWAWAIFGPKRFENRKWSTDYRGPLLIHAGKSLSWMDQGRESLAKLGVTVPAELPLGAIVGRVELVDCQPVRKVPRDPFACGPICWCLEKPRLLAEPIPYKGSQGLFGVPERVLVGAAWEPACRVCGITERLGRASGLTWIEPDLCSNCSGKPRVEKIMTTCTCGHGLMILATGGEYGIYTRVPGDDRWQRVSFCPACKKSFSGLSVEKIKTGVWQS